MDVFITKALLRYKKKCKIILITAPVARANSRRTLIVQHEHFEIPRVFPFDNLFTSLWYGVFV